MVYHSVLTRSEAETLLLSKGRNGNYLVWASVDTPGQHMLSARVNEQVLHVKIRNKDGLFDLGGGSNFPSLKELVDHYHKNPMVDTCGVVIHLKYPLHVNSFMPANITSCVAELLKKRNHGFHEEYEVSGIGVVVGLLFRGASLL